jgi:hypothetical protein
MIHAARSHCFVWLAIAIAGCGEAPPRAVSPAAAAEAEPAISEAPNQGMTLTHWLAGMPLGTMVEESRYDVVIATVESVSDRDATNARPPLVNLTVDEVLRGDPAAERRQAVWAPFPHDVDYGDPANNPRVQAWEREPQKAPAAGAKLILLGEMIQHQGSPAFWVLPVGRFPFSEQNRASALAGIQRGKLRAEQEEQKRRAEQLAWEEKMRAWRAKFDEDELKRMAEAADFVAVGKVCSGPTISPYEWTYDFCVSEIVKGDRRREYPNGEYYVAVETSAAVGELLYPRDRDFLLFLSDRDRRWSPSRDIYKPINHGEGLVEADDAARTAVVSVLKKE